MPTFLNWALAQGMIRGSPKNSLSRSWETVTVTFWFEREARLTCDWLWTKVHRTNLWNVKRYPRYGPFKINIIIDSEANDYGRKRRGRGELLVIHVRD